MAHKVSSNFHNISWTNNLRLSKREKVIDGVNSFVTKVSRITFSSNFSPLMKLVLKTGL